MRPAAGIAPYLVQRVIGGLVTLWGITVVTFLLSRLAPGGPADAVLTEAFLAGERVDAAHAAEVEKVFGLDRPWPEQYVDWLGRSLRLDFGNSLADGESVRTKVGRAAGVSLVLQAVTLAVVFGLALPLGLWSALRRGSRRERGVGGLLLLLYSIPSFVLAAALLWYFESLPAYGYESLDEGSRQGWAALTDRARHLFLPVCCLAAGGVVVVSRYTRSGMLDALHQGFVRAARARGLREHVVVLRHVVRNGLVPVVTLLGFAFPALLSGSVIVEQIFSIPGLGTAMFDAIDRRDYPTVMAISTLTGVATLVGFLIADLAYLVLDPRIRLD